MTLVAFRTGDAESMGPLAQIFTDLLTELATFGKCMQGDSEHEDAQDKQRQRITAYVHRRRLAFYTVFAVAQHHAGLHFKNARLPYRHNSATWPDGQPMAGYTDDGRVTPTAWVSAFFSNWGMVGDGRNTRQSEFHRVLRSALWIYQQTDLVAALDYIADLIDGGHVANSAGAADAGALLIRASARTANNTEAVLSIMRGQPARRADWLVFYPNGELEKVERLSGDGRRAAEHLIARGWRHVQRTRNAGSTDAWLSSILSLGGTLRFIEGTLKWSLATVSPALKAVLSQFEELGCDTAVAMMCMEVGREIGGGVPGFADYLRDLRDKFRKVGASDTRFHQERLLLPLAILEAGQSATCSYSPGAGELSSRGVTAVSARCAYRWMGHGRRSVAVFA